MAITTNGKIEFATAYTTTPTELNPPVYPYTVTIDLAVEKQESKTGKLHFYDHGETYDRRRCNFKLLLTESEISSLFGFNQFLYQYGWEYQYYRDSGALTLEGSSLSGFFPFGPDKGNLGLFTTEIEFNTSNYAVLSNTHKGLYEVNLIAYNYGAYPSYSFVSDSTTLGDSIIGAITNIRTPHPLNSIELNKRTYVSQISGATTHRLIRPIKRFDRSGYASQAFGQVCKTEVELICDLPKAQRILQLLTSTNRCQEHLFKGPIIYKLFGRDSTAIFNATELYVYVANTTLSITHTRANEFVIPLTLQHALS